MGTTRSCGTQKIVSLGLFVLPLLLAAPASGADENAAKALARQNNCFKCHSVDKPKAGAAWQEVAKKNKGKADAQARLIKHLTTGPKVKNSDGTEEEHPVIKAKSPDETKNLVDWILSL